MDLDLLQIILTLWLIERVSITRSRYKIVVESGDFWYKKGEWAIWIYCKRFDEEHFVRRGGRRLVFFKHYVIPHFGLV